MLSPDDNVLGELVDMDLFGRYVQLGDQLFPKRIEVAFELSNPRLLEVATSL